MVFDFGFVRYPILNNREGSFVIIKDRIFVKTFKRQKNAAVGQLFFFTDFGRVISNSKSEDVYE